MIRRKLSVCFNLWMALLMGVAIVSAHALQKNVASQKWTVFAFDETNNTAKTGDAAQINAVVYIDGSVDTVNDAAPTELSAGYYEFDLQQAETNGDYVCIVPVSTTSAIHVVGVPGCAWTTPPNFSLTSIDGDGRVDVIKIAGTSQTANDNGADINAILTDTEAQDTNDEIRTMLTGGTSPLSTLAASDNIGINWADITNPTTAQNLSGTNIKTDQVVASVSGAVGSVTGAVGSVAGNVDGNVSGTVPDSAGTTTLLSRLSADRAGYLDNLTNLDEAISGIPTAAEIQTELEENGASLLDTIADKLPTNYIMGSSDQTDQDDDIATILEDTGTTLPGALSDVQTHGDSDWITATGFSTHSAADVWDVTLSEHLGAGSTGNALNAAGSAGDPWSTSLPGAYGAGSAGYIMGTNLNATISSRSTLTASDNVGINWADITNPTTAVNLSGTNIKTDQVVASVSGAVGSISAGVTVSTNNDKTGYALTQSFPTNFSSLAITGGGAVTAGTVSDKTGYALTQSFPSNFSSLAITGAGAVTAGTVSDKTGYSLTQTFPTNFSALSISATTGLVDITQAAADKVWATGTRALTDKSGFALSAAGIDSIWDEVQTGHTTPLSFGLYLDAAISEISVGAGSADWTADQRTDILEALSIDDGAVASGADLDGILLEIKKSRGR